MAASSPRLSGTAFALSCRPSLQVRPEIKDGLLWGLFWRRRLKEIAERFSLHEIGADESGEGEQTFDNFVRLMSQA
jgi:hypothetical protein